ncbi:MAG: neutral/alkaline non-lysosomal ceramidase N-terminal domain-containing protein, partial [Candidatus Hydrogenedentes bacterium]|nr:neutral/alkaline non-lysosomal ceramidase N-terminal domain-containing protein [Candidatus Hydrogenedentota bacterium]
MQPRRLLKRVLLVLTALVVLAVVGFVLLVGPWPVYSDSKYQSRDYFMTNLIRIRDAAKASSFTDTPGHLKAGWAERDMTPPIGTPLAGYSGRPNDKRSTGVHDEVYARAIVLSDGEDTVALVGADLLMTTINIAEAVWAQVAAATPLTQQDIFFTSSHSHCGPGGYMPGLVGTFSAGEYDPRVVDLISGAIAGAIIDAYNSMSSASISHAVARAPEWIENRTGVEGEDDSLRFLKIDKESGGSCWAVRYSAHPTVLPEDFLQVSGDYAGQFARQLSMRTGDMVVFLGGAVGGMGPVPPEAPTDENRISLMGSALADRVLAHGETRESQTNVDIASFSVPVDMPPMQARPWPEDWRWSDKLRLSPWFAKVAGIPTNGWIAAVRVGDLVFLGLPYDSGGAIAADWADAAATDGIDLWVSSHASAYCGYLS